MTNLIKQQTRERHIGHAKDFLILVLFAGGLVICGMYFANPRTFKARIGQWPIAQAIDRHYQADSIRADSIKSSKYIIVEITEEKK